MEIGNESSNEERQQEIRAIILNGLQKKKNQKEIGKIIIDCL